MEMIMNVFVIMTALLLMLLMFLNEKSRGIFSLFSSVLWFVAAAGISVVHKPYAYTMENASGGIEVMEGVQKVTANWPMTTLFIGLGLFCLFIFFVHYADKIKDWLSGSGYGGTFNKGGY